MLKIERSGLVYIGMTKSRLDERNPLFHKRSSSHSLRRSLGALLKQELSLRAVPRDDGDITNYRFAESGEERLTQWMQSNFEYSYVAIDGETRTIELELIRQLCPPLNITNPENRNALLIKRARRLCQKEAAACNIDGSTGE
jgi:hypothetical protein